MDSIKVCDRQVPIWIKGDDGPIVICPTFILADDDRNKLCSEIENKIGDKSIVLVLYEVTDWNAELSVWPAPAAYGDESFKGDAGNTLDVILQDIIPQIEAIIGTGREKYIIGYSLAGLFSLWCAYNTDCFDGVGSCSGSLWYEGWKEYIKNQDINYPLNVYLSLGGKEEFTENKIMASVGDVTREQETIFRCNKNIKNLILEWNKGGHFSNSYKRLAKGISWLISIH